MAKGKNKSNESSSEAPTKASLRIYMYPTRSYQSCGSPHTHPLFLSLILPNPNPIEREKELEAMKRTRITMTRTTNPTSTVHA